MNEKEYIENRVEDQINWYDNKSKINKNWFYALRIIEIILAACIPILIGVISFDTLWLKTIIVVISAVILVITAIVGFFHFQEDWIEYRTTSESLKHEKYMYLTKVEPYNTENSFDLFVRRIESLISTENSKWSQYTNKSDKKKVN